MHVSKEFLLEAVSLSLLVALLLLGVHMFERAETLMKWFDREQEQKIEELSEYEIVQYAGRSLDGITAISYIKNMVSNYGLVVRVETGRDEFLVDTAEKAALLKKPDSDFYIGSWELYTCEIVRNENESIEQIKLRRKEGEKEE